jgi:hypothetical protein
MLAIPETAACSCVPVSPAKQLKRSGGAFVGRLLEVKRLDEWRLHGDDGIRQ